MTFADKVIAFNKELNFPKTVQLPKNIAIINPFSNKDHGEETIKLSTEFYKKYFSDNKKRHLILGVNPGKNGAGVTGIPFTSPQNLKESCNIFCEQNHHEVSGAFIYRMIKQYGTIEEFYSKFFISNISPLGFIKKNENGRELNRNYYDYVDLMVSTTPFIIETLKKQIDFGIYTDKVFCLGNGDNYKYLYNLNKEYGLFDQVIPLPHPRYIAQYKKKLEPEYIDLYLKQFNNR
jgi:hypothetical protein